MNYTEKYLKKIVCTKRHLADLWKVTETQVYRLLKQPWKISIERWMLACLYTYGFSNIALLTNITKDYGLDIAKKNEWKKNGPKKIQQTNKAKNPLL